MYVVIKWKEIVSKTYFLLNCDVWTVLMQYLWCDWVAMITVEGNCAKFCFLGRKWSGKGSCKIHSRHVCMFDFNDHIEEINCSLWLITTVIALKGPHATFRKEMSLKNMKLERLPFSCYIYLVFFSQIKNIIRLSLLIQLDFSTIITERLGVA